MLTIHELSKSYKQKKVLDNISFIAEKGEIVGLVAPNGTGKTTLLNIIMNFVRPDSGYVTIENKYDYSSQKNEIKMHQKVSFLPDMDDLYDELSGIDHLMLYARVWKNNSVRVEEIVSSLNMDSYVNRAVRTYSLGMKQRLCFAMLLAADTEIMLMDEVMNGLDPDNVRLLTDKLNMLKQQGKTILIASHLLENLELYADKVLFFKHGKIIFQQREKAVKQKDTLYIKAEVSIQDYNKLKKTKIFPERHQYIASNMLCIPIASMNESEIGSWIAYFLKHKIYHVSVGEIGISEWYQEFYEDKKVEGEENEKMD